MIDDCSIDHRRIVAPMIDCHIANPQIMAFSWWPAAQAASPN
jgi:hypothetical protein